MYLFQVVVKMIWSKLASVAVEYLSHLKLMSIKNYVTPRGVAVGVTCGFCVYYVTRKRYKLPPGPFAFPVLGNIDRKLLQCMDRASWLGTDNVRDHLNKLKVRRSFFYPELIYSTITGNTPIFMLVPLTEVHV